MSDQERIWYVHQEKKQSGPFTSEEVSQMVNEDKILHDAFLFKAGWRDWEPLEGCLKELKLDPSVHKQLSRKNLQNVVVMDLVLRLVVKLLCMIMKKLV